MLLLKSKPFEGLLKNYLKEGGPGSGRRGHKTDKQPKKNPPSDKGLTHVTGAIQRAVLEQVTKSGAGFYNRNSDGTVSVFVRGAHGNDPNQWANANSITTALGGSVLKGPTPDPQSGHLVITIKDRRGDKQESYAKVLGSYLKKLPANGESSGKNEAPPVQAKIDAKAPDASDEVRKVLLDSPDMNAASFVNFLKSKGYQIVDTRQQVLDLSKPPEKAEADSASANTPSVRSGVKKQKQSKFTSGLKFRFIEGSLGAASDNGIGPYKFRVTLIQEGLGNLKDCFYYTKAALKTAVTIFEGKKIYADHPSSFDEQTRPERSVRDILGHFENVKYIEADDGRGMLEGDLVTLPDKPYAWARALIRHAIEFSDKHPEQDFIGLSINASGDSEETALSDFLSSVQTLPPSVMPKIKLAQEQSIDKIRVVDSIQDAVSCDLVTEAGAGGRVLNILEGDKKAMKHEDKKTEDMETKQADAPAEKHDDEDQDVALIKKMLKKKGDGADKGGDKPDAKSEDESEKKEATESESEAMEMEAAEEAYEAALKCGHEGEEAEKAAASFMKMAKHMAAKQSEAAKKDDEDKDADDDKKESEEKEDSEKKESSKKIIELTAEIARLKETVSKREIQDHLDSTLGKTGLPREFTKMFKENAGSLKSKKEIDEKVALFVATFKEARSGEASVLDGLVISSEKTSVESPQGVSFEDCVTN